jgi:glycerol-3-phosphate dehydrogenase
MHSVQEWKAAVTKYMADKLGWSEDAKQTYAAELEQEINAAITPVHD